MRLERVRIDLVQPTRPLFHLRAGIELEVFGQRGQHEFTPYFLHRTVLAGAGHDVPAFHTGTVNDGADQRLRAGETLHDAALGFAAVVLSIAHDVLDHAEAEHQQHDDKRERE